MTLVALRREEGRGRVQPKSVCPVVDECAVYKAGSLDLSEASVLQGVGVLFEGELTVVLNARVAMTRQKINGLGYERCHSFEGTVLVSANGSFREVEIMKSLVWCELVGLSQPLLHKGWT